MAEGKGLKRTKLTQLVDKALSSTPSMAQPFLAGAAAMERGDNKQGIAHWEAFCCCRSSRGRKLTRCCAANRQDEEGVSGRNVVNLSARFLPGHPVRGVEKRPPGPCRKAISSTAARCNECITACPTHILVAGMVAIQLSTFTR